MTSMVSRIRIVLGRGRPSASRCRPAATTPSRRCEEQAKARWADVQNQYQRRADLIPNLVATVQGYAAQEKNVLTAVVEARAKATQIKLDASELDRSGQAQGVPGCAEPVDRRARPALGGDGELSRPEIQRQLPGAAVAARRHREPHRGGAARLHRRGARLQHGAAHLPDRDLGEDGVFRQQADGGIHRERRARKRRRR